MADISLPYIPTSGVLDVTGLNKDFYSRTLGESLYQTLNGHIEQANYDASFYVRPEHIRPGEHSLADSAGARETLDFYQDLWSGARYTPIAGTGFSFFQPWDVSVALLTFSCFFSVWRSPGPHEEEDTMTASPQIVVRLELDDRGDDMTHTQRRLPQTFWFEHQSNNSSGPDHVTEHKMTRFFNLQHFCGDWEGAGNGSNQLKKGYHTGRMTLYVERNTAVHLYERAPSDHFLGLFERSEDPFKKSYYQGMHRARCGVRSVTMLRLH